jgi:ABC-type phosphate/phosphonate transport system substrate-binding protein
MTIASLAMYPFVAIRPDHERLWDAVRERLSFEAPDLDWTIEHGEACRRDDLLIGQTCGWPLITDLASSVRVVGTFDCDVNGASGGTYYSLLVSRDTAPLIEILHRSGLTVAANSADSLSGWVSLYSVAAGHGVRLDAVEWTGSHASSVEAVRLGRADLAAIDSVSWTHIDTTGLSVVGRGPRMPCLPLVTSLGSTETVVGELRSGFAAAVRDPSMATTCASLRIRGFLDRELADYQYVSTLMPLV